MLFLKNKNSVFCYLHFTTFITNVLYYIQHFCAISRYAPNSLFLYNESSNETFSLCYYQFEKIPFDFAIYLKVDYYFITNNSNGLKIQKVLFLSFI